MPMEVLAGFVGRVKLQIPVSRLRSEPWVIMFEQLYLVAGPIKLEEVRGLLYYVMNLVFDEEAEAAAAQARKISQLDALEVAWRADQEECHEASHYANSYSSWLSYGTSFMTNIIENIQVRDTNTDQIRQREIDGCILYNVLIHEASRLIYLRGKTGQGKQNENKTKRPTYLPTPLHV
ncbi:Vacuolar protein sorting-associated protein 13D [Portunus trituberculatus]|uniref:Vacuolar protein sorting-associated protein 13D n=1 Tax=Portunus trituberculatus TaxID=210409 RepID=A0A5B7I6D3_PORTR|nr:Vacuolar protein sorting-associated protein 13D [Portunus trituberculatus]